MKKKTVVLLLCTMSVVLASCGKTTDAKNEVQETTEVAVTEPETETEIDENGTEAVNETETAEETVSGGKFIVTLEEANESYQADDGTVIYEDAYSYPKLDADQDREAAEAINADITELEKEHKAGIETMIGYAKEDYGYYKDASTETATEEEGGLSLYDFFPYSSEETSTVERNDDGIFSFVVYNYDFSGGAHGNYTYSGYNYDAKTGARLVLTDLAGDGDAFKQNILSDIEAQCQTPEYQELLFPEYMDYLEDSIFEDTAWYLTDEGLTITCPPYALGPYAAGNIDFKISYDTLETYGLKSEYRYQAD